MVFTFYLLFYRSPCAAVTGFRRPLLKCKDYLAFFAFYQIISVAQMRTAQVQVTAFPLC